MALKTNSDLLPEGYLQNITDYLIENEGFHQGTELQDYINSRSPEDLFKMWLEWNGIIGYSEQLLWWGQLIHAMKYQQDSAKAEKKVRENLRMITKEQAWKDKLGQ